MTLDVSTTYFNQNSPVISIIVPVYNTERYLAQCIESILAQTYTDFELLLIDDGSKDRSGIICDEFAERDSRILVFHKKNGGVSSARNLGLDNTRGEWITFVDSDDTLDKNCLSTCTEIIKNDKLDLLQFMHSRSIDYNENHQIYGKILNPSIYSAYHHPVCIGGAIFRKSIIDEFTIRFNPEVKLGEDQLFVFEFIKHSNAIEFINKILYFYRDNEMSATNSASYNDVIKSLPYLVQYKTDNIHSKMILDETVLNLFFNRDIFHIFTFQELNKEFRKLDISHSTRINSKSANYFLAISKYSRFFAVVFGKIYFAFYYRFKHA